MELDSGPTPPGKRSRAKAKAPTKDTAPATTRARKSKKAAEPEQRREAEGQPEGQPDITVTSVTAVTTPDGEVLATMVATAAYYLAEQRNFEPGHELEDWLEAERQIRALYG